MHSLRTSLTVAALVLLAIGVFYAFDAREPSREQLVPLLQRQGVWPHRHLMSLGPERRAWVLGQVITSAGHDCTPRLTEFEGLREDLEHPIAYHRVECFGSGTYLVALVADPPGSTQVLDCRKAQARGLDCDRDWARMPAVPL